jgi:hypothetical protein
VHRLASSLPLSTHCKLLGNLFAPHARTQHVRKSLRVVHLEFQARPIRHDYYGEDWQNDWQRLAVPLDLCMVDRRGSGVGGGRAGVEGRIACYDKPIKASKLFGNEDHISLKTKLA